MKKLLSKIVSCLKQLITSLFTEPIYLSGLDPHFKLSFLNDAEQCVGAKSGILTEALICVTSLPSDDVDSVAATGALEAAQEPPCTKVQLDAEQDFWASWDCIHEQNQEQ